MVRLDVLLFPELVANCLSPGWPADLIGEWFAFGILLGSNDRRIPRSILCRIAHFRGKIGSRHSDNPKQFVLEDEK
jgi:hypothetical protein